MKKFNSVNKRNGRKFILTFLGDGKVLAFDVEKGTEKEISEKTVVRWHEVGEEIKLEPKKVAKKKSTKKAKSTRKVSGEDKRKKVTPEIVLEMRKKYDSGTRVCDLVREYGMSRRGVECIVYRLTWKYLEEEN